MEEVVLSDGTVVRVEPIPFVVGFDLMNKIPELQYPEEPTVEVRVMKGKGTETVLAGKDSAEWKEYEARRRAVDELRAQFGQYLPWQEGILEWKLAGGEKWESEPPGDYRIPRVLEQTGGFAPWLDTRRIAYIRYVVCKSMNDVLKLTNILLSSTPITEAEVESAVEGFPASASRHADADATG